MDEFASAKIVTTYNGLEYAVDADYYDELTPKEIRKLDLCVLTSEYYIAFMAILSFLVGLLLGSYPSSLTWYMALGCFLGSIFRNSYTAVTSKIVKFPFHIFISIARFQLHNLLVLALSYLCYSSLKPFIAYVVLRVVTYLIVRYSGKDSKTYFLSLNNKICEGIVNGEI